MGLGVELETYTERRTYIDALRVLGTLTVFLFHTFQPFNPNDHWHMRNDEQSEWLGYVILFFNIWVMPLFILLAGYSSAYALKKRSNFQYVKQRIKRVLVPLILGVLIIVPPQVYYERLKSAQFVGSYWEFYPNFFDGIYPKGNFSWHHLWFLVYLFVYSVVGLPIFRFFKTNIGQRSIHRIANVSAKPGGVLLFAGPLAFFHVLLQWKYPPTNALLNDWYWHSQLFLLFIYGFVLASESSFEEIIEKDWRTYLMIALFGTFSVFLLRTVHLEISHSFYWWLYVLKGIFYRLTTWTWLLAILGAGKKFLNVRGPILNYSIESAYPFYIIHQTVIVAVAYYVVQWSAPILLKQPIIFISAFLITLIFYELVKRSILGRIIIGMKI